MNPALPVELPPVTRPHTSAWSPDELGRFLDSITGDPLYPLIRLVAVAGLRRGEALGLRWSDVDLDAGLIHVRQQLLDTGRGLAFGPPKTKSGARTVAIDRATAAVLSRLSLAQRARRLAWGPAWVHTGLVFTRDDGRCMRPYVVSHQFKRLVAQTGEPQIRFHDLRHTSASLALAAGVAMKTVSERLGHSSTAITADLYTHVYPLVAREAADQIADAIPTSHQPNRTSKGGRSPARGAAAGVPRCGDGMANQATEGQRRW